MPFLVIYSFVIATYSRINPVQISSNIKHFEMIIQHDRKPVYILKQEWKVKEDTEEVYQPFPDLKIRFVLS